MESNPGSSTDSAYMAEERYRGVTQMGQTLHRVLGRCDRRCGVRCVKVQQRFSQELESDSVWAPGRHFDAHFQSPRLLVSS